MDTIIQSLNYIHDNTVLRYWVDFEKHTLYMDTQTEGGEMVSIQFIGLLAHHFETVIQYNILLGIDEITIDGFFNRYKELLDNSLPYGFPAFCSIEELREQMSQDKIRIFVIYSSLGLCGFVLAQEVEILHNDTNS